MKSESYLAVGPLWTTRAYRQASQFNAFDTSGSTLMSGLKLVCCMENMLKHHPFNPSCQPTWCATCCIRQWYFSELHLDMARPIPENVYDLNLWCGNFSPDKVSDYCQWDKPTFSRHVTADPLGKIGMESETRVCHRLSRICAVKESPKNFSRTNM
jgi:hypothetical protein